MRIDSLDQAAKFHQSAVDKFFFLKTSGRFTANIHSENVEKTKSQIDARNNQSKEQIKAKDEDLE